MASIRTPITKSRIAVKPLSIKDFNIKRNRLLIVRGTGGLGDILMHRMIFEDIKLLMPDIHITFAIPNSYFSAVQDHPFIDNIVDSNAVDIKDYLVSYNTTTICGRYENKIAPLADKHRSDIWAEHCGVKLTRHNMHVHLTDDEIKYGHALLKRYNKDGKKVVIFSPISAMMGKNLDAEQINGVISELEAMGYCVLLLHSNPIAAKAPTLAGQNTRQWMGIINAADYVISVDTSTFHFAGGIGKPLVGIFSWADGEVYGKYFNFTLVQKHRSYTSGWTCGPCFNWWKCLKCSNPQQLRKPCITEITAEDVMIGVRKMFQTKVETRKPSRYELVTVTK